MSLLITGRYRPRLSAATSGDITPTIPLYDIYVRTAQAAPLTINNPTGSPSHGDRLIIRLKDNGTARAISWGAKYRGLEFSLLTSTLANFTLYLGFMYNATVDRWDLVAISEE